MDEHWGGEGDPSTLWPRNSQSVRHHPSMVRGHGRFHWFRSRSFRAGFSVCSRRGPEPEHAAMDWDRGACQPKRGNRVLLVPGPDLHTGRANTRRVFEHRVYRPSRSIDCDVQQHVDPLDGDRHRSWSVRGRSASAGPRICSQITAEAPAPQAARFTLCGKAGCHRERGSAVGAGSAFLTELTVSWARTWQ
jgi:hypothetical protein